MCVWGGWICRAAREGCTDLTPAFISSRLRLRGASGCLLIACTFHSLRAGASGRGPDAPSLRVMHAQTQRARAAVTVHASGAPVPVMRSQGPRRECPTPPDGCGLVFAVVLLQTDKYTLNGWSDSGAGEGSKACARARPSDSRGPANPGH